MRPDPRKYLWDALAACELVRGFTDGKSFVDYQADALLRSGVERQFEIIGEALNQLSKVDSELASSIPELPRIVSPRLTLVDPASTAIPDLLRLSHPGIILATSQQSSCWVPSAPVTAGR